MKKLFLFFMFTLAAQASVVPSPAFDWSKGYSYCNDFISSRVAEGFTYSSSTTYSSEASHPGTIRLAITTAGGTASMSSTSLDTVTFGGGQIVFRSLVKWALLSTASQEFVSSIGFMDLVSSASSNTVTDGAWIEYNRASAGSNVLQIRTAKAGTRTTTTTSQAVVANTWYWVTIVVNADATSIEYFVNNTSIGTITTNIPDTTSNLTGIGWVFTKTVGAVAGSDMFVDLFCFKQDFTTPR